MFVAVTVDSVAAVAAIVVNAVDGIFVVVVVDGVVAAAASVADA